MDKITVALNERTGGQKPCVVCGQLKWILIPKFFVATVTNNPLEVKLGGDSISFTPVVCGQCGNTHMISLRALGFDLASLKIDDGDSKPDGPKP